ncbi:MAG: hypothetical protein ABSG95_11955 [Solirubrobacteraceae bacterium]|jgi:hypothetical protein
MSALHLRLPSPVGGGHRAVLNRRIHDLLLLAAAGLVPLLLALAVAVAVPNPNYPLVLGIVLGAVVLVMLVANTRLEISVTFLAFFLGCIDGPLKLVSSGGTAVSALQNVLILAVCLGMLMRLLARREPVRLPPLFGWVLAFVLVVLIEAFNPKTQGVLKTLAGFRDQLQWVPFFFFGYVLIRSKARLRKLFLVLGVLALANGVVSTYQTQLGVAQVASWGPGYYQQVYGKGKLTGRTYKSEGVSRVRPMGLGDQSGVGGGFGVVAIAGTFALLATMRKRRWALVLLCFGAMAAIATGLGRLQVGGGVLTVFFYAMLSLSAGRRMTRPLLALLVVLAVALPVGVVFISAVGEGVFSRYASISPSSAATTATTYKQGEILSIPHDLVHDPFGFGLGTAGAAGSFGGKVTEELEGHNVNSETQYNFLVDELGLPGLIVWSAFVIRLGILAVRRLRDFADLELQIYLAAVFAPLIAQFFMGFDGPVSASSSIAPYLWFAAGIGAYWLVGPGRALAARRVAVRTVGQVRPAGAV